jgi:hypothetical protein
LLLLLLLLLGTEVVYRDDESPVVMDHPLGAASHLILLLAINFGGLTSDLDSMSQ